MTFIQSIAAALLTFAPLFVAQAQTSANKTKKNKTTKTQKAKTKGAAAAKKVTATKVVTPRRPAAPPRVFEAGLGDYYSGNYDSAAADMYDYIATNEDTVENYEWAEYFLGLSLKKLEFTQGAAEYLFNVARNRTRPEILPDALQEIEELLQEPHDEGLLIDTLLTDSNFGYLPEHIANFISYHQGVQDLRADRVSWAKRIFDRIDDKSVYRPKALYALGVEQLRRERTADAVRSFRLVLNHPDTDLEDRNRSRLALARILYDRQRHEDALRIYNQVEVPELSTAEASLFLEKAWTSYWLGDYKKTMGILYALEAPSYRDYYAPEKSLLRALVYKNLCHYIPAKREIRRFRFRNQETLNNIQARIDLREDEALRTAALSRGKLGRLAKFRRKLAKEADNIDTIGGKWSEVNLDNQLRRIYELKAKQTDLRINAMLKAETRRIAEELVEFEEQMHLLDYEIGLAIYRRLQRQDARRHTEENELIIPLAGDRAFYAFDGEFWNDELPTYSFWIKNRCFDAGGEK